MNRLSKTWRLLLRFVFAEESDQWLAILRIGLGILVILYTLSLGPFWHYLFATHGPAVITRDLAEALLSLQCKFIPRIGWLVAACEKVGLREDTALSLIWLCLLLSGCALTVGIFSRFSAILAWFLHLCVAMSGAFVSYGVDDFMTIGLFYLMLSPLPDGQIVRLYRNVRPRYPWALGFFRRALQLHLSLIYFSGLTKCLGSGWWNGDNLWRALTRPPFDVVAPEILVRFKLLFPVMGITICLLETAYPVFIWVRSTRSIWLAAILAMHAAIGLMMGMYLFAFVMIVLNLAAFAPDLSVCFPKLRSASRAQAAPVTN